MPQSLQEVKKEKTIFHRLNGKNPAEKIVEIISIAVDLTRGVLYERAKDPSQTKRQSRTTPTNR